jgi:two-component system nitrogen regulation sensor histidine kinase NtrY
MTLPSRLSSGNLFTKLIQLGKKLYLEQIFTLLLIISAIALMVVNYRTFTQVIPFEAGAKKTVILLNLDLVVLLLLSVLIALKIVQFKSSHLQGGAGFRLRARLVKWFGFLLVTPAIIITIFSVVFFNLGIESWFSNRVQTALKNSSEVADAYLQEHKKVISADISAMAHELAAELHILLADPDLFNHVVNRQAQLRSLSEAIVFTSTPEILARSYLTFSLDFQRFSDLPIQKAQDSVAIFQNEDKDRVRALVRIDPMIDAYLLVGRFVDPQVLEHIARTETAVSEYHQLELLRSDFEVNFVLIFIIVSLLLLLLVIWIALAFANRLAQPISNLIEAAERIRLGDLTTRVIEEPNTDELGLLSRAFNRMTSQLETQRTELIKANKQIDRRRHFIETVLAGVTAGVIGLDSEGRINIANASASSLLTIDLQKMKGRALSNIVPEMAALIMQVESKPVPIQIEIKRPDALRTLLVQVAIEKDEIGIEGYVITFDDVTELLNAQRKAAWADVARRIAHEIKNPLTPIQLAAERLKSKYLKQIHEEEDTFQKYIDTIMRQVAYIGDMISEFSEFARMPSPVLQIENIVELGEQAIFLQKNAYPEFLFEFYTESAHIYYECDASQIGRVLTNLLQNAIDSIENKCKSNPNIKGHIKVEIYVRENCIIVTVDDNGVGFPMEGRENLMNPYVTLREKGTGLGLAIVKRSMEDHGGSLNLEDSELGGARVKLNFPLGTDFIEGRASSEQERIETIV